MDRISKLPDDILIHILSFLSTKDAVKTCTLAKRWRNTWTYVPILSFESDERHWDVDYYDKSAFERFVNFVLERRESSNLHTVKSAWHLMDYYHHTLPHMEWLHRMALLKPRAIDIFIPYHELLCVPDSVFSCASLQNLSLYLNIPCQSIKLPKSINLPSLKALKLGHIVVKDCFTQNLLSGCPNLESLVLDCCVLYLSEISSSVLKNLDLIRYQKLRGSIWICCPRLHSLSIDTSEERGGISLVNTSSLQNADIKFDGLSKRFSHNDPPVLNLLGGLSNVVSLDLYVLSFKLKEQLEKNIPICRTFNNLKSLKIGWWDMSNDFDLVACFLRKSPNLQELTLNLADNSGGTEENHPQGAASGVLFQNVYLEIVTIYYRKNVKAASDLVKVLQSHVKTIGNIVLLQA